MVIVLKNLLFLLIIYLLIVNTILTIFIIYFKERKIAQAHFFSHKQVFKI